MQHKILRLSIFGFMRFQIPEGQKTCISPIKTPFFLVIVMERMAAIKNLQTIVINLPLGPADEDLV